MKSHASLPFALAGALLTSLIGVASEPPITALAFTPNGNHVIAVSQSGIHLFDWPKLDLQRTIHAATSNLHCLAFSPNKRHLAVGGGAPSEDGVVEVFSWPKGDSIASFDGHNDSVRSVIWQDDVNLLSGSIDREIKFWHLEKEQNPTLTLKGHSRSVDAICLIEDGRTLVSTGADQSLRIWDVESGSLIRSLNQHTKPVNALKLRPVRDGLPMVASAARDRTIRFWQPTIGRMVRYIRLESEPLNIAWTDDGDQILATCVDGHLRAIDPIEVTVTHDLPAIDGWAYAIAIHPNDQSAAIGGVNGQIRRIDNIIRPETDSETR
ncbi:WD40 repeat domain-containing protein [bacterium]|nr:WD40 repeat domain-containing protein [bacterium]MDA7667635.1 WD40 repeat domain-containing protein [bacterium]